MNRELQRIRAVLEEGDRFLLTTHVSPDGDGFGAELAFQRYLRSRGKTARIVNPEAHPPNLDFLIRDGDLVEVFDEEEHGRWAREADAIFLLDVNSLSRLGSLAPAVEQAEGMIVCVDHHLPGKDGFDLTWVSEDACATGELIFDLLEAMGEAVTADLAEPLYACLLTDTGSFRFAKTSPAAHRMAARLLELGVHPQRVYERLYEDLSPSRLLLMADILATLQTGCDGKVAWVTVTREMLRRRNAVPDDASEAVNYTIALQGVEVGILFKELEPDLVKASLRSKGRLDVNRFARTLGGGGHVHAAGIVLEAGLEEGRRRVLDPLAGQLKDL